MESLWQDVRYGLRMLRKAPAFAAIAVLTLALGIGANTAIFSIADAFMFRPWPVKDADRLTVVAVSNKNGDPDPLSYPDYLDYKQQNNAFTEMTGFDLDLAGMGWRGHSDRIVMCYVPSNFFSMLGLHSAVGRLIQPGEGDALRSAPVVVLGYSYWQHRFAGDPNVLGQSVSVDGQAMTVIGVVEKEFTGPYSIVDMDAYSTIGMEGAGSNSTNFFTDRADHNFRTLATLKRGVTVKQATAALGVISKRLAQQYPQSDQDQVARAVPERLARPEPSVADSIVVVATVFMLLVGLVLLVACINVANLLLVKASARQKEMAIRAAMGAGGVRLIRQLLTESVLLAIAGGAAGALMGMWVCRAMDRLRPLGDFPVRFGFTFDWRVFAYVAAVAIAAGILAGLVPALRARRTDLVQSLREGGRGMIGNAGRHWLRNSLVTAQVAGSLIVLVAAGLFTRSLTKAQSVDLGFEPRHLLNVGINMSLEGYERPRAEAFLRELLRRVKVLPGVESASLAYSVPMSYYGDGASIYLEGQVPDPAGRVPRTSVNRISPDYFVTMRMKMLRGRTFTEADTSTSALVAIVNETFAKRMWPNQDPIGKRFSRASAASPPITVVGEVRDSKTSGILEPPGAVFFVPEQQDYQPVHVLQLRTSVSPETLIPVVEAQVRELDPNMPLFDVMTMEKSLNGANGYFLFRMGAAFAGALGGLGMLLAVVGVYGVISFTASRRTHEIGVRMALGARPLGIFALVFRQAIRLVGAGVGIGLVASLGVAQLLKSLLVGVSSYDPFTFATVAALLVVVTFVACYLPARRATRVDPSLALRYE